MTTSSLIDLRSRPVPTLRREWPSVIAQGGNAAEYPQNTLSALRSALELGCRFVQFDVNLSADGVPVVVQDHWLKQLDPPRSVFAMRVDEVAEQRAHEPERFGERFADVRVPTLAQTAELLGAFPDVSAFVHLSSASLNRFGHDAVIDRVRATLRERLNRIVITTSELLALESLRRRAAQRVGWVIDSYSTLTALKCEAIAPDFVVCNYGLLPRDGRVWRGPWRWIATDVSGPATPAILSQAANSGVSFLQSAEVRALMRASRSAKSAS